MKKVFIFFVFFALITIGKISGDTPTGTLYIEIEGLNSNNGFLLSHLFNEPKDFPRESSKAFRKFQGQIVDRKCTVVFDNIPFGYYAITVHHDENANGKMDKNIFGLPSEGWGISNNPRVIFKLPDFDEAKIKLDSKTMTIKIKMNY